MPEPVSNPSPPIAQDQPPAQTIVIQQSFGGFVRSWGLRLIFVVLLVSLIANYVLLSGIADLPFTSSGPLERFHSGDREAKQKIAVIRIHGTIMPPFTERILKTIKLAKKDDAVKGVLLDIDSPGGLVADSHQIYRALRDLSAEKPTYVSMKRMAASGGVYVAMGAGPESKIFAEPTTWTGSIGVIIPRYDLSELAQRYGVAGDSLKTGEFKDSLNPLRELSERDREVWDAILNDSFERFVKVVADSRPTLDFKTVKEELATGQIFTAPQAVENGLIDSIAYEDEALEALKKQIGIDEVCVIKYWSQPGLLDLFLGSVEADQPHNRVQAMLDATAPKAMYLCSWAPGLPAVEWIMFRK